jgi:DNA/RNA-binding domain of Phe-tRNA-synthetase-like protein
MKIVFHGDISERLPGIKLGYCFINGIVVTRKETRVKGILDELIEDIKNRMETDNLLESKNILDIRNLYWRAGTDPTKTRPSAEALLRMIHNNRRFPRINNIVDANNAGSLKYLLPISVFNMARVEGDITIRFSRDNDDFKPIGTKSETLPEGTIVVADEKKVICHGYASGDADETKMEKGVSDILLLIYGPSELSEEDLREATEYTGRLMAEVGGGDMGEVSVIVG